MLNYIRGHKVRKDNSKISIDLPIEIKNRLINEAKSREMSLSGYIRWIIRQYLTQNKNE